MAEKLDDQPEEDFPLRLGAASGVGRAALEEGPGSGNELRDYERCEWQAHRKNEGKKLTELAMACSLHLISTCLPLWVGFCCNALGPVGGCLD